MPISSTVLKRMARELSGINIEDHEADEPLRILVNSLNAESHLSATGTTAMEHRLLRILVNRLRMERDFVAHPEIAEEKIIAPIFVFGLPRSGTTKMQKLLSVTGDFQALPLWMAHNPSLISGDRSESTEARISDTRNYVEWIDRTNPGIRAVHAFDVDEPEETNPIMEQGFLSAYLPAFVEVPSYMQWYVGQDSRQQFHYIKRVIQYLQWQFADGNVKSWVLKNPTFLGSEPIIREVFPDARMIVTHRHPDAVIASSASLIVNFHKLYSDIDVSSNAGVMMTEGQAWLAQQHIHNRQRDPRLNIIDVGYPELIDDSTRVLERIYADIGLPFTSAASKKVIQWEQGHRQHKFGSHRYGLADFGVGKQLIAEKFATYIAHYSQYF
ncbi:MAG: sulfotransferase [Spongiibacteraceae bacterium]